MKHGFLFVIFLLNAAVNVAANPVWIPLSNGTKTVEGPLVTTTSPDLAHITLTIDTPGFLVQEAHTKNGPFAELALPGQTSWGSLGQAKLPVVRLLLEIPYQARPGLAVKSGRKAKFTLAGLGIRDIIAPMQEPILKTPDGYERWSFSRDDDFYSRDAFSPVEQVFIEKIFYYRAHRVMQLVIAPIVYNPARGLLEVSQRLTVSLTFKGGNVAATVREVQRTWSEAFENNFASMVSNYGMFSGQTQGQIEPRGRYWDGFLIISAPDYFEAADTLARWRSRTGYYVDHVTTLQTGQTVNDIKSYLQQAYATWSDPPLSFVLLVGDVDTIPTSSGVFCGGCASDSDYACVVGDDNVPDLFLGRVSLESVSDAEAVFDRFLAYATATFADETGWLKKACFSSSCDDLYNEFRTHEYCLSHYTKPSGYSGTYFPPGADPGGDLIRCIEDYQYDGNTSGDVVISSLNEGRSLITYSGHCGSTEWSGPNVGVADMMFAQPGEMTPFMAGHCCSAHDIAFATPCFGEVSLRQVAIGYFGSSNSSMWGEDDYVQKAWFDKVFSQGQQRLGEYTTNALIDLYTNYSSSALDYYLDMELLGGDPTMELYTEVPLSLTLVHDGKASVGQNSYTVTVLREGVPVAGSRLCLLKEDGGDAIRVFGVSGPDGEATLALDPAPAAPGIIDITVTALNSRPALVQVHVIPTSGPWLVYQTHEIDDGGGNGDGLINPGESPLMPVTLANIGVGNGTGITAALSTTSPYCSLVDNSATYSDMAVQSQAQSNPDHFRFMVGPQTPSGQPVELRLEWSATGGFTGQTSWTVYVVKPVLEYVNCELDDGPTGNGHLDAGEAATLKVTLDNQGSCMAPGVTALLSADSPFVTITTNQAFWPDIDIGETVLSLGPHFSVVADANTPIRHIVHFQLQISTSNGFTFQSGFEVAIGLKGKVLVINDTSNGAALLIASSLAERSYQTIQEAAGITDPSSWGEYDFLVHASGHNPEPLPALSAALRSYVLAGGRLLVEGGEVLFDMWTEDPAFMSDVMHYTKWNYNQSGNLRKLADTHPLTRTPNLLPATIQHTYELPGDQDAGTIRTDVTRIFTWSDYPTKSGIIAYDNDADPDNGGQIVVCSFDMTNLSNDNQARDQVLENIAAWFTTSLPPQEVPELSEWGLFLVLLLVSIVLICNRSARRSGRHSQL